MNSDYSLKNILAIIGKWFKKIVIATICIALLSAIISLFLPDYYKSTTIFYASNPDLSSVAGIGPDNAPLYIYGGDEDLDRLFSLANSIEVAHHLIQKFDLYKHYGIDSSGRKAELEIMETFKNQYKTVKTKYDAIELIVEDRNPAMAAAIANEARDFVNNLSQDWMIKSQTSVEKSYDANIAELTSRAAWLSDSILKIKEKYNIIDSRFQLEAMAVASTENLNNYNEAKAKVKFYQTTSKRDSLIKYQAMMAAAEAINASDATLTEKFNNGVSELRLLEQEYIRLIDQLSITKERKSQMKSIIDVPHESLHIVDTAKVPKVKSRPQRLIIVIACTVLGFALSVLGALMMESMKKNELIS